MSRKPRVIKILSEDQALRHWLRLHSEGKNKGFGLRDGDRFRGKAEQWALVEIPHALYNADYSEGIENLTDSQIERAKGYAARRTALPPGVALFGARLANRRPPRAYVADGNHRALASVLRGAPVARFYMPLPDATRFLASCADL